MTTMHDLIGVNTHLDFAYPGSPYLNRTTTINAIRYLGVKHLRDCPSKPTSHALWVDVLDETNVRFCAYLPEAGPTFIAQCFEYLEPIYKSGLIDYFEGPNEPDDYYSLLNGNSINWSAIYTATHLSPSAHMWGKPVINISVGSGWSNPDGDYDAIPDMSRTVDFGNAHVYPMPGQDVVVTLDRIIRLASKSVPGKPVMVTELGWALNQGHTAAQVADDILKAAHVALTPRFYLYALFDDKSGRFGLFDDDGTPRAGAVAIHNLLASTP